METKLHINRTLVVRTHCILYSPPLEKRGMKLLRKLTYPRKVDIRYRSGFFVQAVPKTTYASK